MKKIFLIIVIIFLISIQFVSALGVSPGRTSIDFSSNLQREIKFQVMNTEQKNLKLVINVEGDLIDYIKLEKDLVNISSNESMKDLRCNLTLPKGLSPGIHKADIIITEIPENINAESLQISSTVSVSTQIYVRVPYPGKYIDASMDIVNNESSNSVNFFIPIIGLGDEKVSNAESIIDIFSGNKKILTLNTNNVSIDRGEREELSAKWNSASSGEYSAISEIMYDGAKISLEKSFSIGNDNLELLSISSNNFKLGDVAKLNLILRNKLDNEVKSSAEFIIYDSYHKVISDLKSEDFALEGKSNKEIMIFWDTEKIEKGNYNAELIINYDKKSISKNLRVEVRDNSVGFSGIGFVVSNGDGKFSYVNILFIVIGILVLVNLYFLILYLRNKIKKKK